MQARSAKLLDTKQLLANRRRAAVIPIESRITILDHQKIILDSALAEIYGVPVKRLNQQVNRNRSRFPADFMFQLTPREFAALRLQFATSNKGHGGRRSLPYAFTEHGAIMAATVLNSEQAVEMSVFVVRALVRLRAMLATNKRARRQDRRIRETSGEARRLHPGNRRINQETDGTAAHSPQQDWIRAPVGASPASRHLASRCALQSYAPSSSRPEKCSRLQIATAKICWLSLTPPACNPVLTYCATLLHAIAIQASIHLLNHGFDVKRNL
jgi:ORF6N domain